MNVISIIIPCRNEQQVLPLFYAELKHVQARWIEATEIIFVDDASTDQTGTILETFAAKDPCVKIIKLEKHSGQQLAIGKGLMAASGLVVVTMDADLQDPPELLPQMLQKWREGFEIVSTTRTTRLGESLLRQLCARLFYYFFRILSRGQRQTHEGEFALFSIEVARSLLNYSQSHPYWRGYRGSLKRKQCCISYLRPARRAGKSQYTLRLRFRLALDALRFACTRTAPELPP